MGVLLGIALGVGGLLVLLALTDDSGAMTPRRRSRLGDCHRDACRRRGLGR